MKLKIKIKRLNKEIELPETIKKGDWIDLRASESIVFNAPQAGVLKRHKVKGVEEAHRDVTFDSCLIPLGIAVQLPKGFEALILPRSSTYNKYGIILGNMQGVIDNTYCGENDEWKFNAIAFRDTVISKRHRIAQFRIQLSQKASIWQKIKWLLSSGVKIIEVDNLGNPDRGGLGSTGIE